MIEKFNWNPFVEVRKKLLNWNEDNNKQTQNTHTYSVLIRKVNKNSFEILFYLVQCFGRLVDITNNNIHFVLLSFFFKIPNIQIFIYMLCHSLILFTWVTLVKATNTNTMAHLIVFSVKETKQKSMEITILLLLVVLNMMKKKTYTKQYQTWLNCMHIFFLYWEKKKSFRFGAAKFIFVEYKLASHISVCLFVYLCVLSVCAFVCKCKCECECWLGEKLICNCIMVKKIVYNIRISNV